VEREILGRRVETVETPYGSVRVKVALLGEREVGEQPEYEDCAARAKERGVAVREVLAAAVRAYRAPTRS
jgi:pyridinium-3,5-bisthiocarboxylic acid mononucleotide nickel chelatase